MDYDVLKQLEEKSVSSRQAYKLLYKRGASPKPRRAHFVKLRIIIPDEKGVTTFLKVLFFLPMPMFLIRFGMKFVKTDFTSDVPLTKQEMMYLLSHKGIKVKVTTNSGEKILIKTI
ncbi:MAG: hypothetical protein JXB20_00165 [Bacilli bacterium]|nr:hypothetical protein [Bacilli bacterium]MBN2696213.1 hypothetical protein [Bacilli bacterium]